MTSISPAISLADLVTEHPELGRVLEHRGLDYCCRGRQRLDEACAGAGLDTVEVLAELDAAATPTSEPLWPTMDAVALAEHIDTVHHRYLWAEMPRLSLLGDKVATVHAERHPELRDVVAVYEELRADLEVHLVKEERVLFPLIRSLASGQSVDGHCGTIQNPISVMWNEHDRAGHLLAELRSLTAGYETPTDGCASYRQFFVGLADMEHDLHVHIMKENNRLFPLAAELEATARRSC